MKANYYAYYLRHKHEAHKVRFDLRPIIRCFCDYDDRTYKAGFKYLDEHLYLLHLSGDLFVFLMTRSGEVIKKIDESSLSLSDIETMLSENERIGFASYVMLNEDYFSFCSSILAPKIGVFLDFVNQVLISKGVSYYEFQAHPLMHQALAEEVQQMLHIGRTHIEVKKENPIFLDLLGVLGSSSKAETLESLGSIEMILKPNGRKNIKDVVNPVLDNSTDPFEKLTVKAKNEASQALTELYLSGANAISDLIDNSDESRIEERLKSKAEGNPILKTRLAEFLKDEEFKEADISPIVRIADVAGWSDSVCDLQLPECVD